jgi:hypothetical protein
MKKQTSLEVSGNTVLQLDKAGMSFWLILDKFLLSFLFPAFSLRSSVNYRYPFFVILSEAKNLVSSTG